MKSGLVVALVALAATAAAADRWTVQFFHDEEKSSLTLVDIRFPSAQRGIAIGTISEDSRRKHVALVTSDSGARWTPVEIRESPTSLYCLNDSACWMVTQRGIWFSAEGGRDWRKIRSENGLTRVWFNSLERGWAVGAGKKLLETRDGGKSWKKMPIGEQIKSIEEYTVFHVISFVTPKLGFIAGRSEPSDRSFRVPIWMDADADTRKEHPTLSFVLETRDGGETWKQSTTSNFGRITRFFPGEKNGISLALIEFFRVFDYPSEIFQIDIRTGVSQRVFRRKDVAVTDVALLGDGSALAAGFQPPGTLARTPVPGKVRVMRSRDLKNWTEDSVDYRAVARRVTMALTPSGDVWMATDTGMVLRQDR